MSAQATHQKDNKPCQLMVWGVPLGVRQKFKARCARDGESMKDAIIRLMKQHTTS